MFRSVATVALVFIALASQAQGPGGGPGSGGPGSGGPAPTGAPIDGGASILLASGAAYAVRRLRKGRRK